MKKIGITGSIASGKSTAGKILSLNKGPLFSADKIVKDLYKKKSFKILVSKKLDIKNYANIKKKLRAKIRDNKLNLKKLEKIIHPLVRREMYKFIKRNKEKKFSFFEIPLLIESKLMKNFDVIFLIKARKSIRLKRFKLRSKNTNFFHHVNSKQLPDTKKIKYCDHVIVNEKNLKILKKKLLVILKKYE